MPRDLEGEKVQDKHHRMKEADGDLWGVIKRGCIREFAPVNRDWPTSLMHALMHNVSVLGNPLQWHVLIGIGSKLPKREKIPNLMFAWCGFHIVKYKGEFCFI